MKEFINDNFYLLILFTIVVTLSIFTLIHVYQIEDYCETEESNGDWRCVTWNDLKK